MYFLPLVLRELRVATRRRLAFRVRTAVAVATMCLSIWLLLVADGWGVATNLGHFVLELLAVLGMAGSTLAGLL